MTGVSGDRRDGPRWWAAAVATGGDVGAALAGKDWAATDLGPLDGWPASLRHAVAMCLPSRFPMAVWWGPRAVLIHNDAYHAIVGGAGRDVLGLPGEQVWPEVWDTLGPTLAHVMAGGDATWADDQPVLLRRHGFVEECYFTSSFSPVVAESGQPGGVLTVVTETTDRVVSTRRLAAVGALAAELVDPGDVARVCGRVAAVLSGDPADVSSVELFLPRDDGFHRCAAAGDVLVDLHGDAPDGRWPLPEVWQSRKARVAEPGASARDGQLPGARPAVVAPVVEPGADVPVAVLVVGAGTYRQPDAGFLAFVELVASHTGSAVAAAHRARAERERAQAVEAARADRRFRSLVEASTAVAWTTDRTGGFTAPQSSWQAYTGQPWPEHAGHGWSAMLHPDDREGVVRTWREAVQRDRPSYDAHGRVWHAASATYRHFAGRAVAIRDDRGAVTEWIGTFSDIEDRVAAEAAAMRAAAITDALLAASPVGFGWVDTELRFQHVNPALCRINGLPEEAHLGRRPDELFADHGRPIAELLGRSLAEGPITGVEFTAPGPDGTALHQVASYFPIRIAGGSTAVGVGFTVVDVTERTRLLHALGEQRARYERLAATDVLAVFSGADEQITEANDAFLTMLGYTRADLAAGRLRWPELTPPGWEEADRASLAELTTAGRTAALVKEYLHRDGRRVPVLIGVVALHQRPLRWLAYATDLTAERRTQAELRLFRTLVERSGDLIAVADVDGRAVYVNPAGRRLTGLAADAVPGTHLLDLAAPEVRGRWRDELLPAALRDGQHRAETVLAHTGTGALVDVDQQTFTVTSEDEAVRLAVVARDVTERQRSLRRSEALAELAGALSTATGTDEISRAAVTHLGGVLTAQVARFALVNPRLPVLDVVTHPGSAAAAPPAEVPLDAADPLARATRENTPHTDAGPASDGPGGTRALTAPLRYDDGEPMGALQVSWDPPVPAGPDTVDAARSVLETVAGLCSQAVQRVRLGEATRHVADLAAQLNASRTTAQVVDVILSATPRILGARLPAVVLPADGRRLRMWHRHLPDTLVEDYADLTVDDPRPIAETFRTGRRIFIPDRAAFRARYPDLVDSAGAQGLTTTLAVPMLDPQGRSIAAVGMGWSRHRPLRATDLALLDTIIDLCEQTLERTRLAAAEHDLVTRLAGRVTTAAAHPGFDVAVRYEPAMTGLNLGGDWYDVIPLSGDRLAVVVGDVVGHRVEAAADMAQLRTIINTLIRLDVPLPEVFPRVTALLGRAFLGTALAMVIDPRAGRLRLARAGHPYPVIVGAGGTPRGLRTPSTPPLGLVDAAVPVTEVGFTGGATVLAFTDGLVERRTRPYDDGVDELHTLIGELAARPVDEIADTILARIPGTDDDRALVVIRHRG